MFADALLDSRPMGHSRRGWATFTSFGLQAALVACLLILPLFYTQVLPRLESVTHIAAPLSSATSIQEFVHVHTASSATSIYTIARSDALIVPRAAHGNDSNTDINAPEIPMGADNPFVRQGSSDGVLHGMDQIAARVMPKPSVNPRLVRRSVMMEGSLIHRVEPIYPAIAKTARIQGSVIIAAVIGTDGAVENLQVVSGHPLLVPAAINAVSQWRYRPYILNNAPIEVDTRITVNFVLAR